jgi:hypothetical protein
MPRAPSSRQHALVLFEEVRTVDDSQFDAWMRALTQAAPRRAFVAGSLGLVAGTLARIPAAHGKPKDKPKDKPKKNDKPKDKKQNCGEPEKNFPWDGRWTTEVDDHETTENDRTKGTIFFRTIVNHRGEADYMVGNYHNTVGQGVLRECTGFQSDQLVCRWDQTSDETGGTFTINLGRNDLSFAGTFTKDGGGTYKGWFRRNLRCELGLGPNQDPH